MEDIWADAVSHRFWDFNAGGAHMLEDHWEDAKHNREKGGNLLLKHNRRSENTDKPSCFSVTFCHVFSQTWYAYPD